MPKESWEYYNDRAKRAKSEQDWALGLLGGPVGWYNLATGNRQNYDNSIASALGNNYWDTLNDESVYNSMSEDEISAFGRMSTQEQKQFVQQRKQEIAQGKSAADQKALDDKKRAEYETQQKNVLAKVQAFADEMNMPIEQLMQKDGFAQSLRDVTMGRSLTNARNSGMGAGGFSASNADYASKKALLGYQMQRQQAGQQALSNAYGMISNMKGDTENLRRYEQGLNMELQSANEAARQRAYAEGKGQQQSMFGLAGGILGAIYGGPTGAAMGSQIGSSFGGATYGSYKPSNYTYPGYGSGGVGGNKFNSGGNY